MTPTLTSCLQVPLRDSSSSSSAALQVSKTVVLRSRDVVTRYQIKRYRNWSKNKTMCKFCFARFRPLDVFSDHEENRHLLLPCRLRSFHSGRCVEHKVLRQAVEGRVQGLWSCQGLPGHHQRRHLSRWFATHLARRVVNTNSSFQGAFNVTPYCVCVSVYLYLRLSSNCTNYYCVNKTIHEEKR